MAVYVEYFSLKQNNGIPLYESLLAINRNQKNKNKNKNKKNTHYGNPNFKSNPCKLNGFFFGQN